MSKPLSLVLAVAAVALAQPPAGESRLVVGLHQAGANAARAHQNLFLDFYITRPLSRQEENPRWSLWGNVRIASAPRQLTVPATRFTAGLLATAASTPLNELAQSAEFVTGLELRLASFPRRVLGAVAFFGAQGALEDRAGQSQVFRTPAAGSPQRPDFDRRFPGVASSFLGLAPPDGERFDRSYGAGLRLTTQAGHGGAPPATWLVTLGQDQALGGGRYRGVTAGFDVFYPIAGEGQWRIFYLFGTARLRVAAAAAGGPWALEPAPDVPMWDPRVALRTWPASRDTYRIGAGIDLLRLFGGGRR